MSLGAKPHEHMYRFMVSLMSSCCGSDMTAELGPLIKVMLQAPFVHAVSDIQSSDHLSVHTCASLGVMLCSCAQDAGLHEELALL